MVFWLVRADDGAGSNGLGDLFAGFHRARMARTFPSAAARDRTMGRRSFQWCDAFICAELPEDGRHVPPRPLPAEQIAEQVVRGRAECDRRQVGMGCEFSRPRYFGAVQNAIHQPHKGGDRVEIPSGGLERAQHRFGRAGRPRLLLGYA